MHELVEIVRVPWEGRHHLVWVCCCGSAGAETASRRECRRGFDMHSRTVHRRARSHALVIR